MTTLRPLGPSVTLTALLRISTPRRMRSRASVEKRTSLAAIYGTPGEETERVGRVELVDDAHDVAFLHDQQVVAVDLDLGAGPLAEQHAVPGPYVERGQLAGLVPGSRAHSQ